MALGVPLAGGSQAAPCLPISLEDCHAGSFYQLARTLDLDRPYLLLHFDAHSDANAIFGSDELRAALRQVPSVEERTRRLERWRQAGTIQCFDWIEPLMPRPFERVVWVPAETLTPENRTARQQEAREYLDAHEEASPRACADLSTRYEVRSFADLRARPTEDWTGGLPVVASVDLDYFAAVPDAGLPAAFERVFAFLLTVNRLQAVTFAVSTPYLQDQAQAQRLVGLALRAAVSIDNAEVCFEPFARTGPDRSRAARILAAQGQPLPIFDPAAAPPDLRAFYRQQRSRWLVGTAPDAWRRLLDGWAAEQTSWRPVVTTSGAPRPSGPDGEQSLGDDRPFSVTLVPDKARPGESPRAVRWFVSQPALASYNVVEGSGDRSFAAAAPRFIRRTERLVREDPSPECPLTDGDLRPFFDPATGLGSLRLFAEVEAADGTRLVTETLALRRTHGAGFRAALSAQFNRPYVYGSGLWRRPDGTTGPETGWGADCTNFLIAGLRQLGRPVPWGNPDQFRRGLEPAAGGTLRLRADGRVLGGKTPVALHAADVAQGVFLDFGVHMAAVWEDRAPCGTLDGGDLVVHQLEGLPEVLPLRELLARRSVETFRLWRLRPDGW